MSSIGRRFFLSLSVALTFGLGACTGGTVGSIPGAGTNHAPMAARGHGRPGRLVLHLVIPKKRIHHRRKAHYVSPATQSIVINLSGPTPYSTTAPLTPTSSGCSSSLANTFCTLSIVLAPGNYTGTISTWDNTGGGAPGHELSANQSVSFSVVSGQSNAIGITLGGIPVSAVVVPAPASSLSGSNSAGYTLSKCGSDTVSVYGVDYDGNIILGAGAPTPSLQSDNTSSLTVTAPGPYAPNAFTIVRPSPPPAPASTVHLTATVTPVDNTGTSPVSTAAIPMTFNHDICGIITEFKTGITPSSNVIGIAAGPDGNLWFAECAGNRIGRITTAGVVSEFSSGIAANSGPDAITAGPDGNLWWVGVGTNRFGKITTTGTVTEYTASGLGAGLGIVTGPDGNLWALEELVGNEFVAKITTSGTVAADISLGVPYGSGQTPAITAGPDGNIWFTESQGIGTIAIGGSAGTLYSAGINANANTAGITSGPDGNLWFAEHGTATIGKSTTAGIVTEFSSGMTSGAGPKGITAGLDGNLWFAESAGRIGKITTSGTITEYSTGITSGAWGITVGPDGNIWFTESSAIGRLQ